MTPIEWILSAMLFIAMWAGFVFLAQMFTAAISLNALQEAHDEIDDEDALSS